jgi:hypothetical protein
MDLSYEQLATLRAALQMYRDAGCGDPTEREDHIHELATDEGCVMASLDNDGIDQLEASLVEAVNVCRTTHEPPAQVNPDANYIHAGQGAAKARNEGDEARAKHFASHFRLMRDNEVTANRARVTQAYKDAYNATRRI